MCALMFGILVNIYFLEYLVFVEYDIDIILRWSDDEGNADVSRVNVQR